MKLRGIIFIRVWHWFLSFCQIVTNNWVEIMILSCLSYDTTCISVRGNARLVTCNMCFSGICMQINVPSIFTGWVSVHCLRLGDGLLLKTLAWVIVHSVEIGTMKISRCGLYEEVSAKIRIHYLLIYFLVIFPHFIVGALSSRPRSKKVE